MTAAKSSRALAVALIFVMASASAQAGSVGAELRIYPAGLIPAVRAEAPVADGILLGQVGYNATDRRDWGEHEDESGGGLGMGAGWLRPVSKGWHLGVRLDSWWMQIDWEDPGRRGSSDVWVLQPTAVVAWRRPSERWTWELSAALGGEFNVSTDGEDVGEGWILLLGVGGQYGF
jgi:hypothetical protein